MEDELGKLSHEDVDDPSSCISYSFKRAGIEHA